MSKPPTIRALAPHNRAGVGVGEKSDKDLLIISYPHLPSPPPSEVRTASRHQRGFLPAPAPPALSYSHSYNSANSPPPLLTWVFTHCNHAFSLRLRQTRFPQPLEFSQPRTESPALLRTRTLQERAGPPDRTPRAPALASPLPQEATFRRVSPKNFPGDSPLRCKLSRSGRFSLFLRYFPGGEFAKPATCST